MFLLISRMTGIQKIIASFISLILLATLLFALPISNLPTSEATLFDHLFTAISFVCVSGLMSVPLTETYTAFGQIIGMIFMQIGGLSLVTILGLIMMYLKQRLSLSDSLLFHTAVNRSNADQFKAFMSVVFKYTFLFEAIGFIIFLGRFVPLYGWKRGSFTALFLSISAFCNAGFDNLGLVSLQAFAKDWLINLTASSLILAGGLGFSVWFDLKSNFKFFSFRHFRLFWRQLTVNTKVVLSVTLVITTLGTLFPLIIEWNNPATIGSFNPFEKLMTSYFQSISLRTAGFSTLDYTQIYSGSAMLYLIQMLIGGSPGGTAGGIKTTTILVVLLFFYHEVRDLNHVNIFNRTINPIVVRRAFVVFLSFITFMMVGVMLLTLTDHDQIFINLLFEVVSALGTAGVTMGLTQNLSNLGQVIVMILMFIGRVGPLTVLLGIRNRNRSEDLQYASTNLIIG